MSVLVDILLPGKVTEIHPMGRFGEAPKSMYMYVVHVQISV